jgi:magnesium-protoporphyrin IX monomethyl ester (oxidative) cyclase
MSEVILVSMPFGSLEWPAIGIGQLVAAAKHAGIDAKAKHPSMRFADKIGYVLYRLISDVIRPDSLLSEWFFSAAAFENFQNDEYLNASLDTPQFQEEWYPIFQKDKNFFFQKFSMVRQLAKPFIEETAREIVAERPKIVGCSVTYMQYSASLALLRAIKTLDPAIVTMLGGANCEAEMGCITQKSVQWIDFVASGEVDLIFPALCKNIFQHGIAIPAADIPYGIYSRNKLAGMHSAADGSVSAHAETAFVANMDEAPIPDFTDYFSDLAQTAIHSRISPILSVETSRGCWKGVKQPCSFCGQNGQRIRFRAKSSKRVLKELETLSNAYGIREFLVTDTVLNMSHFTTLFRELAEKQKPYNLFLETVSTLTEAQIELLADAGVVRVQPGIESLNDAQLCLLNKGNSAIRNIAFLKFSFENGIRATWNLLYDIPGDQESEYQETANMLPLLYHLEPPTIVAPIRFDRFSSYCNNPKQFDLQLSPMSAYQQVYPFTKDDLTYLAYYFENAAKDAFDHTDRPIIKQLKNIVSEWRILFYKVNSDKRPELVLETPEGTTIFDSRPCAVASEWKLDPIENKIYKSCRSPITRHHLCEVLACKQHGKFNQEAVMEALQRLIDKKLLLHINNHYLALATYKPKREIPILTVAKKKTDDQSTARTMLGILKKLGI